MATKKNVENKITLSYTEISEVLQGMTLIGGLYIPDMELNCNLSIIRKRLSEYQEAGEEARKNLFNELAEERMVPVEGEEGKKGKKEKKKVLPAGKKSEAYQKAVSRFMKTTVDVEIPSLKMDAFKAEEGDTEDPRTKIPTGFFQLVWPILDKAQSEEKHEPVSVPVIKLDLNSEEIEEPILEATE